MHLPQTPLLPFFATLQFTEINSGPPPSHFSTGTAITAHQASALQLSIPPSCTFASAAIFLNSELVLNGSQIIFSLCREKLTSSGGSTPSSHCYETGTFTLPARKQLLAEWRSSTHPVLDETLVWLVVEGNAPSFDSSFSWLDAETFEATTAFRAGEEDGKSGEWVSEGRHRQALTVQFKCKGAGIGGGEPLAII